MGTIQSMTSPKTGIKCGLVQGKKCIIKAQLPDQVGTNERMDEQNMERTIEICRDIKEQLGKRASEPMSNETFVGAISCGNEESDDLMIVIVI